jgi:hypothetical protein
MREKIQETVAQQQASADKPMNNRPRIAKPEAPGEKDSSFFDTFYGCRQQNKTMEGKKQGTFNDAQNRSVYLPQGEGRTDLFGA